MGPAFALLAAPLLAACEVPPAPLAVPEAPPTAHGSAAVDPAAAGRLFGEICLATLPDFAGASAALARLPFDRDAEGVWRHRDFDFAVRFVPTSDGDTCAVTFRSAASAQRTREAFQDASGESVPPGGLIRGGFQTLGSDGRGGTVTRASVFAQAPLILPVR